MLDTIYRIGMLPSMVRALVSSSLLTHRLKAGLTQVQLAELAHTSQSQIDRLEKGQRKLTQLWAKRLAPHVGCHWLELLGEAVPKLSHREQALMDLYRGLNEADQESVYRVTDAMAQSTPGKRKGNGG